MNVECNFNENKLCYGNVSISDAIVLNYMIIHKRRIVKV